MYEATILLSSSSLPTQGDLRLAFLGMFASLQHHQQQSNHNNIVNAIYNKLKVYWDQHLSNSSSISAMLDPRYKLTTFNNIEERNKYIDHLKTLFSLYLTNSNIIVPNRINPNIPQHSRNYFLNLINNNQVYSASENPEFSEIDNYLSTPNDLNTNPLMWWKSHHKEYPILSIIAKDYLMIQATSVAAEQAFSVAGNTITQTRNKLDSETKKEILCLKSWIENGLGIIDVNNESNEASSDISNDSDYSDDNNSDNNSNSSNTDTNHTDTSSNN
jgi:hypothetical protein